MLLALFSHNYIEKPPNATLIRPLPPIPHPCLCAFLLACVSSASTHMQPPRDDHDAPPWLTATEFKDTDAALDAKVKQLAELMRASTKTVSRTYTY